MKKSNKKLSLNRANIRSLSAVQGGGGYTTYISSAETEGAACETQNGGASCIDTECNRPGEACGSFQYCWTEYC